MRENWVRTLYTVDRWTFALGMSQYQCRAGAILVLAQSKSLVTCERSQRVCVRARWALRSKVGVAFQGVKVDIALGKSQYQCRTGVIMRHA